MHLAFGSLILGRDVTIGQHTRLGFFSVVRGTSIRLGEYVQIGAATIIETDHIDIGDDTKINEQVFVGGLQFPDSRLIIGRNCQIMQATFVNPARSVVIGDDTGIGGDCLLFGHTSWLSRFEGYSAEFDSIEIGSSVSVAWRVFLLPGTRIGDGAVIGANSLVRGEIPSRCLAIGFPARIICREREFPRSLSEAEKEDVLREIVDEFSVHLRSHGFGCTLDGGCLEVKNVKRGRWLARPWSSRLQVVTLTPSENVVGDAELVLSLCRITHGLRKRLTDQGTMWMDLEAKEQSDSSYPLGEETAMYLRRHGVRFFRVRVPVG